MPLREYPRSKKQACPLLGPWPEVGWPTRLGSGPKSRLRRRRAALFWTGWTVRVSGLRNAILGDWEAELSTLFRLCRVFEGAMPSSPRSCFQLFVFPIGSLHSHTGKTLTCELAMQLSLRHQPILALLNTRMVVLATVWENACASNTKRQRRDVQSWQKLVYKGCTCNRQQSRKQVLRLTFALGSEPHTIWGLLAHFKLVSRCNGGPSPGAARCRDLGWAGSPGRQRLAPAPDGFSGHEHKSCRLAL